MACERCVCVCGACVWCGVRAVCARAQGVRACVACMVCMFEKIPKNINNK